MRIIDLRGTAFPSDLQSLLPRPKIDTTAATAIVTPLVEEVRERGAAALYDLAERFDGVRPHSLRVPPEALGQALLNLDPAVRRALEVAIENARIAHTAQLPEPAATEVIPGGIVYQRWVPLGRVGLYVPGGLAVYPSSVVMNVVTAQVAGVKSMVVASPPQSRFGGLPHPTVLAACAMLGVDEVIAVGGAQAIAAMAYGFTDGEYRCRAVDKVTGPGNVYVAAAKRVVQAVCGIDSEAGTTEIAVLADETAQPEFVCADLISQAEHDPAAASVLVTNSSTLVDQVQGILPSMVDACVEKERIATALAGPQSAVVLTETLEDALEVVESYAPEHLEIQTQNALELSERITTAGAVFIGDFSPVPLGDYVAGSNHVLPTGGTARYSAGLNVTQYLRSMQVVDYSRSALRQVAPALIALAEAEGLPAHGQAAQVRFQGEVLPSVLEEVEGSVSNVAVRLPFRPELSEVEPYGAPMIDVPVRLNVNENPFQPNPEVIDSIAEAVRSAATELNRYADRDAVDLRQELASYVHAEAGVQVAVDRVWAANGSNEIMIQLLQAFGGPGRRVLALWPTYSMYEEYARDTNTAWVLEGGPGANPRELPRFDSEVFIAAMRRERPAVVFVPSPNNPTGESISNQTLETILEVAKTTGPRVARTGQPTATIVVLDEAYAEFRAEGTASGLELLDDHPHLVVTRTLSKAFAAAGLRLGYMIASPEIVHEVQKVRLPYHLSLVTQAAARACLQHAGTQMEQIALIRAERDELASWLEEQGFVVAPSSSNFLLFGPLSKRHEVWRNLVESGVLIREVGPEGYLRVTVGTPTENEIFRQALKEAL
ncbi:histidinol-phosphate transaminase [Actinomyces minihominis]|uniref:histidinol-phosphate transaminase n=1 Tax=Actinomyces minihominis TaxID=2002838 RepID=UPI000C0846F9|nr:histidinol-phosphate transaminase [Actinomyces minihominis]